MDFKGRAADLELLSGQLRQVALARGGTRGRAVIMTGRVGPRPRGSRLCGCPRVSAVNVLPAKVPARSG
jgi:hypothetical protein